MRRLLVSVVLLSGCSGAMNEADDDAGETFDSGWVWDGGFDEDPDGGAMTDDAGAPGPDAGETADAGRTDAGQAPADAGVKPPDAGVKTDAGVSAGDGGVPPVPPYDAGVIPDAGPTAARQRAFTIGSTDAGNGYYEYLPPGYSDAGPAKPLLVFWHGVGENDVGDGGMVELRKVLANGPPKLINQNRWSNGWPFVVLSPQHRGGGCPGSGEIRNFIIYAQRHYNLDAKRLYLTGLSCGAIGSWSYVNANLDSQVAAAVLICGDPGNPTSAGSTWQHNLCNLGRLPIWSFHGSADTTVFPANDRDTMQRLIACPAPPRQDARYVEYPGVGHDSWSRTYDLSAGHDIYSWLLLQSKP